MHPDNPLTVARNRIRAAVILAYTSAFFAAFAFAALKEIAAYNDGCECDNCLCPAPEPAPDVMMCATPQPDDQVCEAPASDQLDRAFRHGWRQGWQRRDLEAARAAGPADD